MRFDIAILVSLLPALGLAAKAYGPGTKHSSGTKSSSKSSSKSSAAHLDQADDAQACTPGTSPSGRINDCAHGASPGTNDCGSSTFSSIPGLQDNEKALVDDCKQLLAYFLPGDHEWVISSKLGQTGREIARYKTCGFFASAVGSDAAIGNGDTADLLSDSINKFGESGTLAVQGGYKVYVTGTGTMACSDPQHITGQAVDVSWSVSKTNKFN